MPRGRLLLAFALGVVVGVGAGAGGAWLAWGRQAMALRGRLDALEASTAQVQGERDRLHRELSELVRERREMADTADHLRRQVEEQLRRLESLAQELTTPTDEGEVPGAPAP